MIFNSLKLRKISEEIYEKIGKAPALTSTETTALMDIITYLDQGKIRVAEKVDGEWVIHHWVKKAIIAYIHFTKPQDLDYGLTYHDHTQYKFSHQAIKHTRIVPSAFIRFGAYLGKKTIIMPSFINMGAYIGDNTMIDTYASIGSCAQIGTNTHISAGTGIGGVLEPLQACPTIIEDHCFIGARCEISEGVIVKKGAVLASGLFISQSTRIFNRLNGEISYGIIPENAVVVPGSIPSKGCHIAAAIIVKFSDHQTREKTKINDLLRSFD